MDSSCYDEVNCYLSMYVMWEVRSAELLRNNFREMAWFAISPGIPNAFYTSHCKAFTPTRLPAKTALRARAKK